jgi:hypothetical protein
MKGATILKVFIAVFFIISIPRIVLADTGKPPGSIQFSHISINALLSDTIIPKKKVVESTKDKPSATAIKVVPKARRQAIPIPVKVKVKPVKIIKPKIIKPLIKVLH